MIQATECHCGGGGGEGGGRVIAGGVVFLVCFLIQIYLFCFVRKIP